MIILAKDLMIQQQVNTKEQQFTKLIEENQGIVHKVCKIYTNDPMSHDDLFQEIVLQLWRSFDSFKGNSKFSTWMYRVGLNTAITLYRKKSKRIDNSDLEHHHFALKQEEPNEEQEHRLQLLYSAIKQLNDIERALILLFLEDLPYKDIAETLGITEVNARVKMNRTKNKLKEIMTS